MANVTLRRKGEILQNLFRILEEEGEGLQAKDAIARLESRMELTEFEKSRFPNNPELVRFPKIARFATIASVKAGWLRKRSGTWTLTEDAGRRCTLFLTRRSCCGSRAGFTRSGRLASQSQPKARAMSQSTRAMRATKA